MVLDRREHVRDAREIQLLVVTGELRQVPDACDRLGRVGAVDGRESLGVAARHAAARGGGTERAPEQPVPERVAIERAGPGNLDEPDAVERRMRVVGVEDEVVVEPVAELLLIGVQHARQRRDREDHALQRRDAEGRDGAFVACDRGGIVGRGEAEQQLSADVDPRAPAGRLALGRVGPAAPPAGHDAHVLPALEKPRDPVRVAVAERQEILRDRFIGAISASRTSSRP